MFFSIFAFGIACFLINREKLTSKYKMIMIKNKDLSNYINKTMEKLNDFCAKSKTCDKYLRGNKINETLGAERGHTTTSVPKGPEKKYSKAKKETGKMEDITKVKNESGKVDVVYLWVNGTDHAPTSNTLQEAATPNRFREWNELKYSIKLLRMHATNLRNIVVITNGNRPTYDNMQDIVFVDHSEFIPTQYLPTYSSRTIQFNLDKLFDQLTDPFVLMDDDFFITKPLDLITYTKSKTWYIEHWGHDWGPEPSNLQYVQSIINSKRALKQVYPTFQPFGVVAHVPCIVQQAHMRKMKSLIDTTGSMTPYRSKTNLQFQYMMAGIGKYGFNYKHRPADGRYHFIMMTSNIQKLKRSFQTVLANPKDFVTLNDDIQKVTTHREVIKNFLDSLVTLKIRHTVTSTSSHKQKDAIFAFHHAYKHSKPNYMNFIHSILDQIKMHTHLPVYFITNAKDFVHFGVTILPELPIHDWKDIFKHDSGPWNTGFTRFMNIEKYMERLNIARALQVETDNIVLKDINFSYFKKKYNRTLAMTPLGKNMFTGSIAWIGSIESLKHMNLWMKNVWSKSSVTERKKLVSDVGYSPSVSETSSEMLALGAYARHNRYLQKLPTVENNILFDPGTYGQVFIRKIPRSHLPHHTVASFIGNKKLSDFLPMLFNLHHYRNKANIPNYVHATFETIDLGIPCTLRDKDYLETLLQSVKLQTLQPKNIIVSMQGDAGFSCPNCIFLKHNKSMNAAENRNAILNASNATYVTFMDCDDLMHPRRTEILFNAMKSRDVAWHNYDSTPTSILHEPLRIIYDVKIDKKTHMVGNVGRVAHGHMTVRRGSTLMFRTNFPGEEDVKFAQDMLNNGARSVFVKEELIQYIPSKQRRRTGT